MTNLTPCIPAQATQVMRKNLVHSNVLYPWYPFLNNKLGYDMEVLDNRDKKFCAVRINSINVPDLSEDDSCAPYSAEDDCVTPVKKYSPSNVTCEGAIFMFKKYYSYLQLGECPCKDYVEAFYSITNLFQGYFKNLAKNMPKFLMSSLYSDVTVCNSSKVGHAEDLDFAHYTKIPIMELSGKLTVKALVEISIAFQAESRGSSSGGDIVMPVDRANFTAIKTSYPSVANCCSFAYDGLDGTPGQQRHSNEMFRDPSSGLLLILMPNDCFIRKSTGEPFMPIFRMDAMHFSINPIAKSRLEIGHARSSYFSVASHGMGFSGYASHGGVEYGGRDAEIFVETQIAAFFNDRLGVSYVVGEPTAGAPALKVYDKAYSGSTPIASDAIFTFGRTVEAKIENVTVNPDGSVSDPQVQKIINDSNEEAADVALSNVSIEDSTSKTVNKKGGK